MTRVKGIILNFKRYWFLMSQLISRDFKVKYKRSVLGVLWSLLNPILMMTVMAIVFSQMFKFKVDGINYLVYLMTGIVLWNYFSQASNMAMTSVVENFSLIKTIIDDDFKDIINFVQLRNNYIVSNNIFGKYKIWEFNYDISF